MALVSDPTQSSPLICASDLLHKVCGNAHPGRSPFKGARRAAVQKHDGLHLCMQHGTQLPLVIAMSCCRPEGGGDQKWTSVVAFIDTNDELAVIRCGLMDAGGVGQLACKGAQLSVLIHAAACQQRISSCGLQAPACPGQAKARQLTALVL